MIPLVGEGFQSTIESTLEAAGPPLWPVYEQGLAGNATI